METQKQQIVDRIKQANNILVTVKSNPTVDHLSACIALTLALNKMGKHATAVFSGDVPSTIEFLQPEKTLEKNTDSLRDFIIALDKSKADKLRYKVEDKVVKIFITPYRTSINEQDLNFSQGDFNVDVVLALGVHLQTDLDQAITAHGRILHDATVAGINVVEGPNLGSLNWTKIDSSSLSEMVVELIDGLDKKLLDGQTATAALTGIVAETDRFSNNKTSPQTMSVSSELMTAGANQQLVATKLAEPVAPPVVANTPAEAGPEAPKKQSEDGMLEIEHEGAKPEAPQIHIDDEGSMKLLDAQTATPPAPPTPEAPQVSEAEAAGLPAPMELPDITPEHTEGPHMILQPPTLGGQLSAESTSSAEFFDPMMDSASGAPAGGQPHQAPMILNREPLGGSAKVEEEQEKPPAPEPEAVPAPAPVAPPVATTPELPTMPAQSPVPASLPPVEPSQDTPDVLNTETLSDIEKQLNSPHVNEANAAASAGDVSLPDVSSARDAVEQAIHSSGNDVEQALAPIQALNAQPVNLSLHNDAAPPVDAATPPLAMPTETVLPAAPNLAPYAPQGLSLPGVQGATSIPTPVPQLTPNDTTIETQDPNAPPPVPPPMLPPIPGQ